ncbi:MAG TPA: glycoside hydrolase family 38 C-terminal domain-containing protein [Candidatus Hydrogenedentes bacterium]|nr:glycoside hydrolase family 38 C-terminal domain-containing protein [Candidatus Hydrogenedentota bacterium]
MARDTSKKRPQYEMHVISNTHWDREWRRPYQHTRMMLVDVMDTLLDILDKHPEYRCYHLDSQTVVLDDYLEIRPENRKKIEQYVKKGRILVGPWYSAPDMNAISGESIVRNLLLGHKMARAFGGVMKAGYTPFSFGHTEQLPQIYAGFGIDTCLFYRGVGRDRAKAEFWWESPDGTRALCSQFSKRGRYNFYFHVYRPAVDGRPHNRVVIEWDEIGLPVRCADAPNQHEAVYAMKHKSLFRKENIGPGIRALLEEDKDEFTTPYLLLMQGCDTTAPNPDEPRIIAEADRALKEGRVFHSTLPDYLDKLRKAVKDLPVLRGEMRVPAKNPGSSMVMGDGISARMYLKQANAYATTALEKWAEPMAAINWVMGAAHPLPFLELAWKYLFQNHAHDSIMSCSVDEVHEDMMFRFEQAREIAEEVARRSLSDITRFIDTRHLKQDGSVVTVWNSLTHKRSAVTAVTIDFPQDRTPESFALRDPQGKEAPVQIASMRPLVTSVQLRTDWPQISNVNRVTAHVLAEDLPGVGYKAFTVVPKKSAKASGKSLIAGKNTMENEHVRVTINRNGSFDIVHKATRATYSGLNVFENGGSAGIPWTYEPPKKDNVITSLKQRAAIAVETEGPLVATYRVSMTMMVPVATNADARSTELGPLEIVTRVTVRKGCPYVEVATTVNNTVRDHRLRALFPTNIKTDVAYADRAFDVLERPIPLPDSTGWAEAARGTAPQLSFLDVNDGRKGLAVLVDGLPEGDPMDDAARTIAITLLRTLPQVHEGYAFPPPKREGLECLGAHTFRYAVYPHAGSWGEGKVCECAANFTTPLRAMQSGRNEGALPLETGFLELTPGALVLSGVKKAENRDSIIIRFYNPTNRVATGQTLRTHWPIAQAFEVNLEEERVQKMPLKGKNAVALRVAKKKICSIELALKR